MCTSADKELFIYVLIKAVIQKIILVCWIKTDIVLNDEVKDTVTLSVTGHWYFIYT